MRRSQGHRVDWEPENAAFWYTVGRRVARRNMWISVFVEHIGFSVWSLWSVLALFMSPKTGFHLSAADKFLLASIVTFVGSAVRPLYGYAVTRLGGRTWTTLSTAFLIVPVIAASILMRDPAAPVAAFVVCAAVSGVGGGSFASSTTNINFFFPEREKGRALGINAGAGNLGVATVQLLGLLVIAVAGIKEPWILSLVFLPLVIAAVILAGACMDNLPGMRTSGTVYGNALKDPYCWMISLLYIGTFGSFIGYSFAFGLVLQNGFGQTPLQAASLTFIGPLIGSLIRPVGGWLADRSGAPKVTLVSFTGLALCTVATIVASETKSLTLFIVAFVPLFILSGLGNGSTYAMISEPYKIEAEWAIAAGNDEESARLAARRKSGAVIAIAGTFGGLGGVAINLAFRQAYATAHNAEPALIGFLIFYAICIASTLYAQHRSASKTSAQIAVETV